MRDLDMTSLRLFASVCDTGSLTRTAEQSNIVGSAISKRLTQLESSVGVPLLVRRRRGVEPTAAGQALLERVRVILASCDGIERDMSGYLSGVRGTVRILATASVLAESLASDVARFLKNERYRDIRIELEERLSHDVIRGVREGMAAIGICWNVADFSGLALRPYRHDHLSVVTPAGHPLAARSSVTLRDTLDYEHVCMPLGSAVLMTLRRAASLVGRELPMRVTVSNFDSAFRVIEAGLAISILPREIAGVYAHSQGLAVIPLDEPWARRRFALCARDIGGLAPAAGLVLAHLAACGEEDGQDAEAGRKAAESGYSARLR